MPSTDTGDTKHRLIEAAGEIFSSKGFKSATVREICRHAKANVAAVHYHFGDKEGLYGTLLVEAFEAGLKRYPPHMGLPADARAEERLHAFVHSFLLRMLGEGPSAWCGKLMARELQEPTQALDQVAERYIRPLTEQLRGIVAELLGEGARADDQRTKLCAMSVAGQCQYAFRSRTVMGRLMPNVRYDEAGIAELARHVADFSISALRNLAQQAE
ncbi:transcriptional regulator, TetR family [Humidesulfovibrio mexicanus]|uniref:Transcriptional regulator, TetR family n=1 Tax=Humidesulfovibrio mexicanus TaxID=147047 RepID=A0A238Y2P6_9BACT|nr:CerR family C-terminal domain-containing protein [Humidesulfovibrio mexicanus]SNR64844.1 transcriptional regulator, TetR family [Humidesulfovibrio mexicanus]